jgi:tetratricopeptide (TPR) repeat protein
MDLAVINTGFLKYLIKGTAHCDQQVRTLIDLAKKADLKARLLFLRGYDSISHHSVCEIYLDGKFRVFDSDYGYVFRNHHNEIATFLDIQKHGRKLKSEKLDALLFLNKDFSTVEYFRLYEPTYEFTVAKTNFKIRKGRMFRAGVIDLYYNIFGQPFLVHLLDLYFKVEKVEPFLRARLKHLLGRFQSAITDYNICLNENKNIFIVSEGLFFTGQLFWDMQDFNRCISTFEQLLREYPDNRWIEEIYFYLGDAYEHIKEIAKARFYYSKIKDSHTTPAPQRLMQLSNYKMFNHIERKILPLIAQGFCVGVARIAAYSLPDPVQFADSYPHRVLFRVPLGPTTALN